MFVNSVVSFFLGVVVGVAAALLLAPKSGEELRADMGHQAQIERDRVQKEYHRAVGEVQERLDKVHADVQSTLDHVKEQAEVEEVPA